MKDYNKALKKWPMKKTSSNKDDIVSSLEEALEHIGEAVSCLQSAASMMDKEDYDYNINGNMYSYVINYLTNSPDSIEEKIQAYIDDTNNLGADDDEDDD